VTIAGAMVATMKAQPFSGFFTLLLVQREAGPVMAIAVIVGLPATAPLAMTPAPTQSG